MLKAAKKIDFRECKVGDRAELTLNVTPKLVADFAGYTGDYNPLHMDEEFAAGTSFKKRVVHGMAYGSFVSKLIGMDLPGEGALWTSQSFDFLKPVFLGDTLKLWVEVTKVTSATRSLSLKTEALNQLGETVMRGTGEVMLLEAEPKQEAEAEQKPGLALVTGGSRGIGEAVVRALAAAGHPVVFTYYSDKERAQRLRDELVAKGGFALALPFRAEEKGACERLAAEIKQQAGAPSVLIFSGASPDLYGSISDTPWEKVQTQLEIHTAAAYRLLQAFLPEMIEAKNGSVVMMGTSYIVGVPPAGMLPYIVAKQAMYGLMKSLAVDLGPKGIRVNMVAPGMTDTELLSRVPPRSVKVVAQQNPLRRIATPKDIAESVAFLASPRSSYTNGHCLVVSGGSVSF